MSKKILFCILLAITSLAWGQTYKWRDASGGVHYSDTLPPQGARDVQQLSKVPAPAQPSASGASKSYSDKDVEFRKRLADKKEAETKQAKSDQEDQTRARNCEQAKAQLAALESGVRMVKMNAKGERVPMDDADREQARIESKKAVDIWCK